MKRVTISLLAILMILSLLFTVACSTKTDTINEQQTKSKKMTLMQINKAVV